MKNPTSLRERLLQETITALADSNAQPSLRELAERLGVTAMALYRHFPNKAALLDAVVDTGFSRLHAHLLAADQSGNNTERLIRQGMTYIGFADEHPPLFRLMFSHHTDPANQDMARHKAFALLQNRVDQWLSESHRQVALACWSLAHGLAMLKLERALLLDREQTEATLRALIQSASVN
jgi:AcrR family transcriptional regulator